MSLLKLMQDRYSVRSFSNQKVEEEKIKAILKAGQLAPTACNNQPIRIYVVKTQEGLEKWSKCSKFHFNEQLVLIVCYDKTQCWNREFDGAKSGEIDASIVQTHMMLEAEELGIGSTWIMYFIPEAVRTEFNLPENIIPTGVLVMGYASDTAAPSPRHSQRKNIEEIIEMV